MWSKLESKVRCSLYKTAKMRSMGRAVLVGLALAAALEADADSNVTGRALSLWRPRLVKGGESGAIANKSRHRGVSQCTNTCPTARNGRCEDGSSFTSIWERLPTIDGHLQRWRQRRRDRELYKTVRLLCDLGTDCADCGRSAWLGEFATLTEAMRDADDKAPLRDQAAPTSTNVQALLSKQVQVNAARTNTQPPFVMLYTSPSKDTDVSSAMANFNAVEPLYNQFWHKLSRKCCAAGGLALDVGANFGYYSLLAARMGCRVVAWEPVPVFRQFIEAAARINNLTHMIHLRPAVVSDVSGATVEVQVPERGYWGTASVNGLNVDPSIRGTKYTVRVPTETLDSVVTEQACIMKLDVEGYEPQVIRGAKRVFATMPPRSILTGEACACLPFVPRGLRRCVVAPCL